MPWGFDLSGYFGARKELAASLIDRLAEIPLNSAISSLNFFRSSDLAGLLGTTWLSDKHAKAAVDCINLHPNPSPIVCALGSVFLATLRLKLDYS